ncbi:MAG: hypothetical protein JXA24_02310 [Proteobacteria bacterium]|nr:hypothetical protein [Pseudomonadota bacterium]
MGFSIQDFLADASRAVAQFVDLEEKCAREVAGLNESPANRMWESSLYSTLASGGVPHHVVSELRVRWEPQFKRYRQLCDAGPVRTPALRIFRICAESVALRFGLSLSRVLSKDWIDFAVRPSEEARADALLSRMRKLRVEERWAGELASTWEFLFAPGGQDDRNLKPPRLFYELADRDSSHVKFVHPYEEDLDLNGIREFRQAELERALSLIEGNRLSMVLGHPGWRPVARGFDLWMETLKLKLSSSGTPVADFTGAGQDLDAARRDLDGFGGVAMVSPAALAAVAGGLGNSARIFIVAETGLAPHEAAAKKIGQALSEAGLRGEIAVLAVDHKALNSRQAEQIIFGERGMLAESIPHGPDFIKDLSRKNPMLPGVFSRLADALEEEMSMSGKKGAKTRLDDECRRTRRLQPARGAPQGGALATPSGCWNGHLDRITSLSKSNIITVGQCSAPFFTMSLALRA